MRRGLQAEARLFQRGTGWRGEHPELATFFTEFLGTLSKTLPADTPGNVRGAARSLERHYVDRFVNFWNEVSAANNRPDLINHLLEPGFKPTDRSQTCGAPSQGRTDLQDMILALAKSKGQTVSVQRVKVAIRSRAKEERM